MHSYASGLLEAISGPNRSVVMDVPMDTATSANPTQDAALEATSRSVWRVPMDTRSEPRRAPMDVTAATATSVRPTQDCV